MQRFGVAVAAAVLAGGLAGGSAAQVLDIAPDGAVTTVSGPSLYLDPNAAPQPINPKSAPASEPSSANLVQQVDAAAARHGLSPKVVEAVAWRESRFDPQAVSPKGAVGVMQLMPSTAKALGVDPADPAANVEGGAAYLAQMLRTFNGDLRLALAAYNAGPEAVRQYAGIPPFPETKAFVDAILNRLANGVALESVR
jgi:soluble lytic murein transglycosylase-like protein